jgi:hypothetical protein
MADPNYSEGQDLLAADQLAMTEPLQLEVERMDSVSAEVAQSYGFAVGETLSVPSAPVPDANLADNRKVSAG